MSGREVNKIVLNELGEKLFQIMGGTADVSLQSYTSIDDAGNYYTGNRRGRNIHFGVREHAMGAIINGISLYEDFIPFCTTFLSFSNYMLPSIRMAALMKCNSIFFFTHDSIYVGEEGATYQPIEELGTLRSIIGLTTIRPCDGNELLAGYKYYLREGGPVAFILSKQPMDVVDSKYKDAEFGGYILKPAKKDADIIIYASGSEVSLAVAVANELEKKYDVSVVSMPSLNIFEKQTLAYKNKVLQKSATLRVAIEASNDSTWYKYLGDNGLFISVEDYQKSGNGKEVYESAGFNVKDIVRRITKRMPR